MGFESARRAIFANQKSIDIVGNNLSNVNTAGYTRQRVDRAAMIMSSSGSRVASSSIALQGQGVETLGVSQTRDSFLDKRFRDEYSNAGYHGQTASMLEGVQNALGDGANITDEAGLYGAITSIYESLNDFMKDPTMDSQANIVMSSFKNMTQVLHQIDSQLTNVATQYTEDLGVDIDRVNDIAAQISHLNEMISKDSSVVANAGNEHYRPNELMDQRNLLIDELASYGNIAVSDNADGSTTIKMGEHTIVDGSECDSLILSTNDDGSVGINWRSDNGVLDTSGGTLISSVHYLNGSGKNAQTSNDEPYQGIPYYRQQIDAFARELANVANHTIPIAGEDGKPKIDPVTNEIMYKTLIGAKTDDGTTSSDNITASNIKISDQWTDGGPGYFIYSKDETVEDYAQELAIKLTESKHTFSSYGETYEGTFMDFEVNLLGKLGSDISFHAGRQNAYATVADDFLNQRDSISGVSSDEETADMIKYQKSYEAASRVMTVLDELLDVVINRMGRAGL